MTDLLRITQLHKHFGKTPVLQDINLSVTKGEVLGLAGESGSGKSTLALCIAGLHAYGSGEILCNGTPLSVQRTAQNFRQQAQHIQMVFQDPLSSINPRMTIADDDLVKPLFCLHFPVAPSGASTSTVHLRRRSSLGHGSNPDSIGTLDGAYRFACE